MVRLRDLIAAEERLDAAEAEYREYNNDPSKWAAFESVDKQGRRSLNVSEHDFERRDSLRGRVDYERRALLSLRRAFVEEV